MRCLDPRRPLFASGLVIAVAPATDAATITRQGNGKGAAPCMACHGVDGAGQAGAGNPRLAGLDAAYLQKQLEDFASGSRSSPVMRPTTASLDPAERRALAACYSKLPLPSADSVGAHFPPLAGQPVAYLAAQLEAWHHVTRDNDSLQLMQHLSAALSAQDIRAVAAWCVAPPLPAPEIAP